MKTIKLNAVYTEETDLYRYECILKYKLIVIQRSYLFDGHN